MGYIVLPDSEEFYKTGIYIPIVSDNSVGDNWYDANEYEYLVELIWGHHMKGYIDIDTFLTQEFKKPFCLFFTTNFKEEVISGSKWKHLIAVEGYSKEEGVYLKDFYRVGFVRKDLPENGQLGIIKNELKKYDEEYYESLKGSDIRVAYLGYVKNYGKLLDEIDSYMEIFGGTL